MYYLIQTLLIILRGDTIILSFYMWEHWVLAMSGACHFGQAFPWWSKMVISSARHSILKILSPVNRDLFFFFFNWSVLDLQCFRCLENCFNYIYIYIHTHTHTYGPTLEFLPGESQGQTSLAGYSPWGLKESNMTERLIYKLSSRFFPL